MRIFPAALRDRDGLFGACWTPGELGRATGTAGCARSCVWAALDCPTSAPVANFGDGPPMVLASLTARLGCPVRVGEPHTILSWASRWTGASAAPPPRCTTRTGSSPAPRARSGSSCASNGSRSAHMATHYRTCPFCEATCGLEIETEGREVVSVRGDADDVFSRGFICPKAYGIKQLHEDRTASPPRWSAATASSSRPAGTRRSRRSTAGSRR